MIYTTSMLKHCLSEYRNPLDKIKRDVQQGYLIRIVRGKYETDENASPCFLAPVILSPSYLSFDWALHHYGLISEKPTAITSASLRVRKNKSFTNKFGRYEYSDIPTDAFPDGVTILEKDDYYAAKIATKEKAICDSLSKWRVAKNVKDLKFLLFVEKGIDGREFSKCDFKLMARLAALYRKTNLKLLIKLIRKEYDPAR